MRITRAASSVDPGTYLTVVQAGADASTPRPVGAIAVYWLCADGVDPVNKVPGDIVFNADPVAVPAEWVTVADTGYWNGLRQGPDVTVSVDDSLAFSAISPQPTNSPDETFGIYKLDIVPVDFPFDGSIFPGAARTAAGITASDANHVLAGSYKTCYVADSYYGSEPIDDQTAFQTWLDSLDMTAIQATVVLSDGWSLD